mmetsp:Transcript_798/g.1199  ORF Transcript_798/g.1199 Transcript_798/m.1199 type:complete len:395 (+) Transcript_798:36-1220(+)
MSKFHLGPQPNWCGTEPCVPVEGLIDSLLQEGVISSLKTRGYGIVPLSPATRTSYDQFCFSFEEFCRLDLIEKADYALKQFCPGKHSPNQYHGFSKVGGLKEQFMFRVGNQCQELKVPKLMGERTAVLYEHMDQLCRALAVQTLTDGLHDPSLESIAQKSVDGLLDPVFKRDIDPKFDSESESVTSQYVPPGYVSSSILDCFHYQKEFREASEEEPSSQGQPKKAEQFINNHGSHTDSGLMTAVVATDFPGLEVFDPILGHWVALEELLHNYVSSKEEGKSKKDQFPHRNFVTVFWSESVNYLNETKTFNSLKPCLHRVGRCEAQRCSVVFKQRTAPLRSACRYQEDYELAATQYDALEKIGWLDPPGMFSLPLRLFFLGVLFTCFVIMSDKKK